MKKHGESMSEGKQIHKKRVLTTAAIYTAAAWAAVEALLTVVDRFGMQSWWATLITALFVAGLPVTVYMVWRTAGAERKASIASIIGSAFFLTAATAGIFWFTRPFPPPVQPTLAIVPCDFEGETDHRYRAEGLAEDVHARLSRINALKILSWNSSLFVRDKGYKSGQIAEVLHVDRLVQCSMKSGPERIQLSAELIDPLADTILWDKDYDFAIEDMSMVVIELASTLLDILGTSAEAAEINRVQDIGTFSPQAYDLFLQSGTTGDIDAEEAMLTQALAIDPNYAEALVSHAHLYLRRVMSQEFEDMSEPRQWLEETRSLSQRALELDSGVYSARNLLARVCEMLGDYYSEPCSPDEIDRLKEEECEVRGNSAEGWACRHELLGSRNEDESEALKHWLELEPTSADANMRYMADLWFTKRSFKEALAVFDTMRALEPDDKRVFGLISNVVRKEGRLDETLAWRYGVTGDKTTDNPWLLARLSTDYMALGLFGQAAEIGLQVWEIRRASATHFMPLLWARMGEPDRAVEAMEWMIETLYEASASSKELLWLASFYMTTLRNYKKAGVIFDQVLVDHELSELCEGSDECMIELPLWLAHNNRAIGNEQEAAVWLETAEKVAAQTQDIDDRLGVLLLVAQGRHKEAVGLLRDDVFAWHTPETGQNDLTFPIYYLEDDAMLDPLRVMPEFQQLLDDYNAQLEPMQTRVLEAEQSADWAALRQNTYQWAEDKAK